MSELGKIAQKKHYAVKDGTMVCAEQKEHPLSIDRVSRWFAYGFTGALANVPLSISQKLKTENDWQKEEIARGHAVGTKALAIDPPAHIQYWIVSGTDQWTHEMVEKKVKKENADDDRG